MFVQLACAFRYGSDDLDVMGLCFRKDIWIQQLQIFPDDHKPALDEMHDTLLKKAGDDARPFTFEVLYCRRTKHALAPLANKQRAARRPHADSQQPPVFRFAATGP